MYIYNYNPSNGFYVGAAIANESPLEPGVFLIPAHSTTIAPPDYAADQIPAWNGTTWDVVPLPPPEVDQGGGDPVEAARWNNFYQGFLASSAFAHINAAARTDASLAVDYADCGFALTRASVGLISTPAIQAALDNLLADLVGAVALLQADKDGLQQLLVDCGLDATVQLNFAVEPPA